MFSKYTKILTAGLLAGSLVCQPVHAEASASATAAASYELVFTDTALYGSNLADFAADAAYWYASHDADEGYKKATLSVIGDQVFTGTSIAEGSSFSDSEVSAAVRDVKLIEISIKGRYLIEALEAITQNAVRDGGAFATPGHASYLIDPTNVGLTEGERYHERTAYLEKYTNDDMEQHEHIDQTKNYRVMIDEETCQAYELFTANATIVVDSDAAATVGQAMQAYWEKGLEEVMPETYADPMGDGRVQVACTTDLVYDEENDIYTYTITAGTPSNGGLYYIYVDEDHLRKKLQGIIGNMLYHGEFKAAVNGGEEEVCLDSRYAVFVPVTETSGTFTLRYDEKIGGLGNIMLIFAGVSMLFMIIIMMTMGRRRKKTTYRYRG